MPAIQALPTWSAWNNANFTSSSGLTDSSTGQPFAAGGLNPGDYFDANNEQAASSSYTTNGLLYGGRYRYIQVDSGATAANVKTGTIGYLRAGNTVKTAVITNAGSGYTPGVYYATVAGGGGSGTVIQYVVGAGGTVTGVQVIAGGFNLTSAPTATVGAPAGTGATIALQLGSASNMVTSADKVTNPVRPVVFLNSIDPGNFGFVQELGTATVLGAATGINSVLPSLVIAPVATSGNGTVASTTTSAAGISVTNLMLGPALDLPVANNLFKIILQYVPVVQD